MARRKTHEPLGVLLNNRLVGRLTRQPSGAIGFQYEDAWLNARQNLPISLSMPLREDQYTGEVVSAVFDNLLPDSDQLLRMVAEKVGARGTDSFSLLSKIGRDCVGAMQFAPESEITNLNDTTVINGDKISETEIEDLLNNLSRAPLGIEQDHEFRISVAGAQEKTALLFHEGNWIKPTGTTPTTHIFKTQIGRLPDGVNLTESVENEFYCLKLFEQFGFNVNNVEIGIFGDTTALIIERFDRRWTQDGRLIRLPQEDLCQALSVPPTLKYENRGGPGIRQISEMLLGSDEPQADRLTFFKAQILNWLIGASDAHAKNFSVFIGPNGTFRMTPLYDILTVEPFLQDKIINRKDMQMAMCIGNSRHYRFDKILGRHFIETGKLAGLQDDEIVQIISEIIDQIEPALDALQAKLPEGFSQELHETVSDAIRARAKLLKAT